MAKKFSKLVLFSALAGAAAAGTYYYLRNKANLPEDEFDDFDDFDDFDEDLDDEIRVVVIATGFDHAPYSASADGGEDQRSSSGSSPYAGARGRAAAEKPAAPDDPFETIMQIFNHKNM